MAFSLPRFADLDDSWQVTLKAVLGGLLGLALMVFTYDASGWLGIGPEREGWLTPLAATAAVAAALAGHRVAPRRALLWSCAAISVALAILMLEVEFLTPVVLALPFVLVVANVPAQMRLLGLLAILPLGAMMVDGGVPSDFSGLTLLAFVLAYLVAWALREGTTWARRTAWSLAVAWSAIGLLVALADLFVYIDAVAILSAVVTGLVVLAVAGTWVVTARTTARTS